MMPNKDPNKSRDYQREYRRMSRATEILQRIGDAFGLQWSGTAGHT